MVLVSVLSSCLVPVLISEISRSASGQSSLVQFTLKSHIYTILRKASSFSINYYTSVSINSACFNLLPAKHLLLADFSSFVQPASTD